MSECECPYDGYCKHMAAVAFAVSYGDFEPIKEPEIEESDVIQYLIALDKEQLIQLYKDTVREIPEAKGYVYKRLTQK
jgi:uncharacterized Zn finger protein